MSSSSYTIEPFPTFVDSIDTTRPNYYPSMSVMHLLSPSGAMMLRKQQDNLSAKLFNYLHLHYYRYEVTMGLYVMTPAEKIACNTLILGILAAISFAMYFGLQPFVVKSICQVIYYVSGSVSGIEDLCPDMGGCS